MPRMEVLQCRVLVLLGDWNNCAVGVLTSCRQNDRPCGECRRRACLGCLLACVLCFCTPAFLLALQRAPQNGDDTSLMACGAGHCWAVSLPHVQPNWGAGREEVGQKIVGGSPLLPGNFFCRGNNRNQYLLTNHPPKRSPRKW